jgi:tetratricopeptide (TPR) repeat protein
LKPHQPAAPDKSQSPTVGSGLDKPVGKKWQLAAGCCALAALVWVVFGQVVHFEFLSYDDPDYVFNNPAINQGFSWSGLVWIFLHANCGAWFPITDLSHQIAWQLFGPDAGAHHLVNVLLHGATTMALFLALIRLTGCVWPAWLTAALFAVHPLRAESVAWVVERKDVLSGLFFALTLWAWSNHLQNRARLAGRDTSLTSGYFLALIFFALGLMAKSMLVTLPAVLLLLDWWPLKRVSTLRFKDWKPLVVEKIPFFVLSALICAITLVVQKNAVVVAENHTLAWRSGNALQSIADYVRHSVWPAGLCINYAASVTAVTPARLATAIALISAISLAALLTRKNFPWLAIGWFWFLVMLLPVVDIMQAGQNARADRYTYLPQIGLCLAVTWTAWWFWWKLRPGRHFIFASSLALVVVLAVATYHQTAFWKNNTTLWSHAVACAPENALAQNNLGSALSREEKWDEAVPHFQHALLVDPDLIDSIINLGIAQVNRDNYPEAIKCFQLALQKNPNSSEANYNLGVALAHEGHAEEAAQSLERALQCRPGLVKAHYALGVLLGSQGQWDAAVPHLEAAFHQNIGPVEARYITGISLAADKKWELAAKLFEETTSLKPDFAEAYFQLGRALGHLGKTSLARQTLEKAITLANTQGNPTLVAAIRAEIATQQPGN